MCDVCVVTGRSCCSVTWIQFSLRKQNTDSCFIQTERISHHQNNVRLWLFPVGSSGSRSHVGRRGRSPAAVLCDRGAAQLLGSGLPQAGPPQSLRHPGPQRVPGDHPAAARRQSPAELPPERLQALHQVRQRGQVHREAAAGKHPAAHLQLPPRPALPLPQDPEHQAPGLAEQQAPEPQGEAAGGSAPQLRGHQPPAAERHPEGQWAEEQGGAHRPLRAHQQGACSWTPGQEVEGWQQLQSCEFYTLTESDPFQIWIIELVLMCYWTL